MTKSHAGSQPRSPDDILLWPDGTWCYRSERAYMLHMSDDYQCILVDTPAYRDFFEEKQKSMRMEPCSEEQNRKLPL